MFRKKKKKTTGYYSIIEMGHYVSWFELRAYNKHFTQFSFGVYIVNKMTTTYCIVSMDSSTLKAKITT